MNERTWRCPVQKLGEGTSKKPEGTIEAAHSAPYWGNRPSVDPGELDLDISTAGEVGTERGYWKGEDNQSGNTLYYFDQERQEK